MHFLIAGFMTTMGVFAAIFAWESYMAWCAARRQRRNFARGMQLLHPVRPYIEEVALHQRALVLRAEQDVSYNS